jgi:hypothetical protein
MICLKRAYRLGGSRFRLLERMFLPYFVASQPHGNPPIERSRDVALDLLASVTALPKDSPKALIAPHAGYIYSGPVTAGICQPSPWHTAGHPLLRSRSTRRVVSSGNQRLTIKSP